MSPDVLGEPGECQQVAPIRFRKRERAFKLIQSPLTQF